MRKHSRPAGKKKEKGKSGRYMTMPQALQYLQIDYDQFRSLCITKCVHPREPKKKFKGFDPCFSYYHVKDLDSLMPKPLPGKINRVKLARKEFYRRFNSSHFLRKETCGELECGNPVNNKDPIQ